MRRLFVNNGSFALGPSIGVFVTLISLIGTEVFLPNLIADRAILGAVIGGFIAGAVSLIVTIFMVADVRQREQEGRQIRNRGLGISTLLKANKFKDANLVAKRHFFVQDDSKVLFLHGRNPIWTPVQFLTPNASVTLEEKSHTLLRSRNICNDLISAEEADRKLYDLMTTYEGKFKALISGITKQKGVRLVGRHFSGEVELSNLDLLELDDLRKLILKTADASLPRIERVISDCTRQLRDEHKLPLVVEWDNSVEPTISSNQI